MPGRTGGDMGRRIGALEAAVERRVEEEIDAVLNALEERLPREELDLGRLHAEAGERGRRGLEALFAAMEAARKGGRRWG